MVISDSCVRSDQLPQLPFARRRSVAEAKLCQPVRSGRSVRSEELVEGEFLTVAFPEVVSRGLVDKAGDRSGRKTSHPPSVSCGSKPAPGPGAGLDPPLRCCGEEARRREIRRRGG